MGGRAIKKTYTVLHADTIFFVLMALLITGTAFLQSQPIVSIVLQALPFVVLMGITEALAYRLRMQRKSAWILSAIFLVFHFVLAVAVQQGFRLGGFELGAGSLVANIASGYLILSALYGFLGLLSGQTLRNFFGSGAKITVSTNNYQEK